MSRESYRKQPEFRTAIGQVLLGLSEKHPIESINYWHSLERDMPPGVRFAPPVIDSLVLCYANLLSGPSAHNKDDLREEIIGILEIAVHYIERGKGTVRATPRELAKLYKELGYFNLRANPFEALRWLRKSEGIVPNDHVARMLTRAQADAGDIDGAIRLARRLLADHPNNLRSLLGLAELLLENDDVEEGRRLLERAKQQVLDHMQSVSDQPSRLALVKLANHVYVKLFPFLLEEERHAEAVELLENLLKWAKQHRLPSHLIYEGYLKDMLAEQV